MRDVKGYEGIYSVTSCGKVWSHRNKKFLSPAKIAGGYLAVCLCKDGDERMATIHRLVADAYIGNPDNHPQVNHKDEDKTNNSVLNLEWCTQKYNLNYGSRNERLAVTKGKKVFCKELNRMFNSVHDAAKSLCTSFGNIAMCCRGERKTACGYHWEYA